MSTQGRRAGSRRLLIETRGAGRINRLAEVASSKTTTQKIVELAWTAGPVTLIAAYGGYYMGNGKMLPTNTLIFFIAYTVIAGLIGLGAHLIYRLTREQRTHQAQSELETVVGGIPDRILELRDLNLRLLDEDARDLETARLILAQTDLGPEWLGYAIRLLDGSEPLCRLVEELELLRRAGLKSAIEARVASYRNDIDDFITRFDAHSPQLAQVLRQRFQGERASLQEGIPRTRYFIERVFAAIDDEDDTLMTATDVQEVFTLLFELLSGRRIPMLVFDYAGDWAMGRATNELEKERLRFRLARARSYSRLLALATWLNDTRQSGRLAPQGVSGQRLLAYCLEQMDALVSQIESLPQRSPVRRQQLVELERALGLYHQAFVASRRTQQEFVRLQKRIERWKNQLPTHHADAVHVDTGDQADGLRITEDQIYLADKTKMKVVRELAPVMLRNLEGADQPLSAQARLHALKQLAIRIILVLDEAIELRRPEVQRAIDTANTLNMGYFESDLSTRTKIGWGESMVKELAKDMSAAAEALVQAIYQFYGLQLSEAALAELAVRYRMQPERIEAFYAVAPTDRVLATPLVRPFDVPRSPLAWRLLVNRS